MATSDAERWQRVRDVFDSVVDLDPGTRAARLEALCAGDNELRHAVEVLLAHDGGVGADPIEGIVAAAASGAASTPAGLSAGQRLLHYRLTEPIGEGGMGVVWRAVDETLGRDVAIKVLPPGVGADARRLQRFEREAKLLASLNHTNIAAIFSLHGAAQPRFLAMEFVPGHDLAVRLARGSIPLDETLAIAVQVAAALEEAHERGIVHRDLKPANIALTPSGQVKVLDFGLAKAFSDGPLGDSGISTSSDPMLAQLATREGVILGTAAYMPPEQARGQPVDKRADIWAFGVVVFEMLAGTRPFPGDTVVDVLAAVVTSDPDWTRLPTGTPAALVRLLGRCLQKDARQRLRDIGEARIELERVAREPAAPRPTTTAVPAVGLRAPALSRRRVWMAAAVALAAAVIGGSLWMSRKSPVPVPAGGARSLAVLPLVELSAGPDDDHFAEGLSEELLNLLARNPQLRVTGRTSSFRFKAATEDSRAIGRQLGVSALLEGSVRRSAGRVRITAQLVNAADGFQLWSQSYDRELDDILAVQDDIARAVTEALQVTLLGRTASTASPSRPTGPAYNAYLQGTYFRGRNTRESLERAVAFFEEAIRLDPDFAPAWAGLSRTRSQIGAEGFAPPDTVVGEARRAAERAVELDPKLADGHLALSIVRRAYDWDWAGADAATQRALQLEPNNADIVFGAARMASTLGRIEEALALTERAATLDPLNVQVVYRLGRYQQLVGNHDAAVRWLTRALEFSPEYPAARESLALVLLSQSRVDAALAELAREPMEYWRLHGEAIAYELLGRRAEADAAFAAFVARFQNGGSLQIAQLYALRRDAGEAVAWLERGYLSRDAGLSQLKATAYFDRIAGDPRFQAFLGKMRLPR